MNSTRLTSLLALVAITAGLAILASADELWLTVLGAALVAGSAIALTRHFWRENDRKRKQATVAYERALATSVESLRGEISQEYQALNAEIESNRQRMDVFSRGILEYVTQVELDIETLSSRLDRRQVKNERLALRYRDDVLNQLSGVIGVYSVLRPTTPYAPFGGWAIGGDCAQRLLSLILEKRPKWILEIGSGLSTVIAAQALDLIGEDGRIISLEHETQWLERSREMVAEHGVSHRSQILHAPLTDFSIGKEIFHWYDISGVALPEEVQLIFVDGPPKATGDLARFPALPLLHDRLAAGGVILMDDAARPDERAAIDRWKSQFPDWEFRFHKDSKGTVEIIKGKG
jgi:predicted O-methyltransferase YrrM